MELQARKEVKEFKGIMEPRIIQGLAGADASNNLQRDKNC
jgi:hypothetical protein